MMNMSEKGKKLLAQWEGTILHVYNDAVGLPTIGVGHLLTRDELTSGKIYIEGQLVKYANGLTQQQALDLLGQDLDKFEKVVDESVTVDLKQNQFDALVSFAFNVGAGAFKGSSLLKVLNQGQYAEVPDQLQRWAYAGGRLVQGLATRRENEIKLWKGQI